MTLIKKILELNFPGIQTIGGEYHTNIRCNWFKISNFHSNCGSLIFHSFRSYVDNVDIKEFEKLCGYLKTNGVGALIAVLGQTFYNSPTEEMLLSLGFTQVDEYQNYRHGNNYTQRLYTKKL